MADIVQSPSTSIDLHHETERAEDYRQQRRAGSTKRVYALQLRKFQAWCSSKVLDPYKHDSVRLWLSYEADLGASISAMAQGIAAIALVYVEAGLPKPQQDPAVQGTWEGIQRSRAGTPPKQAAPLTVEQLRTVSKALPDNLRGIRDRAILLLGFALGCRRSELVALNVEDVVEEEDGLAVFIRKSKIDQRGHGHKVGVPFGSDPSTCPVRAVRAWQDASGITEGALFRGVRGKAKLSKRLLGQDVRLILKRTAERAGVDPAKLSGHSLRSGLATAAAKAGKPLHTIAKQTGQSFATLQRYIRDSELFSDNAASGIGL